MTETTLQRYQSGRDAASKKVGELMNEISDTIAQAIADGFYVDGLTGVLQRAYSASLSVGPELDPRVPDPSSSNLLNINYIEPTPPAEPDSE